MYHKLLELESERIAKEDAARGVAQLTHECIYLLNATEAEVGVKLGDKVPRRWKGWLCFRRPQNAIVICRGQAFPFGILGQWRAGLDVSNGADYVADFDRGFEVTMPNDMDHLLINFGTGEKTRVFIWYGEGIAPYKLVFEAVVDESPEAEYEAAAIAACGWILNRPKHLTLLEYLKQLEQS